MPINPAIEKLLPLREAAKLVPPARGGNQTSHCTLWRWIREGFDRYDHKTKKFQIVLLEACRTPAGRYLTSAEALGRFLNKLNQPIGASDNPTANMVRIKDSPEVAVA